MTRIKRLKNPTFTENEYLAEGQDPILAKGEIACVLDESTGKVTKFKIGNGMSKFSELDYLDDSEYPFADIVTNTIGDVIKGQTRKDDSLSEMIRDMVSPYIQPSVSNVKTNANGVDFFSTTQLEIGNSLGSAISVSFDINDPANLATENDPVNVEAAGFVVANPYPVGQIALTPDGVLSPDLPTVFSIKVRIEDTRGGFSGWVTAYIRFDMRLRWGTSDLADLTTSSHALALTGGGSEVKTGYKNDYEMSQSGYGYVLIPSDLLTGQPPIIWTEVSDPNAPAGIGMIHLGTLSVANVAKTYNYEKYRTPFYNNESVKVKAS